MEFVSSCNMYYSRGGIYLDEYFSYCHFFLSVVYSEKVDSYSFDSKGNIIFDETFKKLVIEYIETKSIYKGLGMVDEIISSTGPSSSNYSDLKDICEKISSSLTKETRREWFVYLGDKDVIRPIKKVSSCNSLEEAVCKNEMAILPSIEHPTLDTISPLAKKAFKDYIASLKEKDSYVVFFCSECNKYRITKNSSSIQCPECHNHYFGGEEVILPNIYEAKSYVEQFEKEDKSETKILTNDYFFYGGLRYNYNKNDIIKYHRALFNNIAFDDILVFDSSVEQYVLNNDYRNKMKENESIIGFDIDMITIDGYRGDSIIKIFNHFFSELQNQDFFSDLFGNPRPYIINKEEPFYDFKSMFEKIGKDKIKVDYLRSFFTDEDFYQEMSIREGDSAPSYLDKRTAFIYYALKYLKHYYYINESSYLSFIDLGTNIFENVFHDNHYFREKSEMFLKILIDPIFEHYLPIKNYSEKMATFVYLPCNDEEIKSYIDYIVNGERLLRFRHLNLMLERDNSDEIQIAIEDFFYRLYRHNDLVILSEFKVLINTPLFEYLTSSTLMKDSGEPICDLLRRIRNEPLLDILLAVKREINFNIPIHFDSYFDGPLTIAKELACKGSSKDIVRFVNNKELNKLLRAILKDNYDVNMRNYINNYYNIVNKIGE